MHKQPANFYSHRNQRYQCLETSRTWHSKRKDFPHCLVIEWPQLGVLVLHVGSWTFWWNSYSHLTDLICQTPDSRRLVANCCWHTAGFHENNYPEYLSSDRKLWPLCLCLRKMSFNTLCNQYWALNMEATHLVEIREHDRLIMNHEMRTTSGMEMPTPSDKRTPHLCRCLHNRVQVLWWESLGSIWPRWYPQPVSQQYKGSGSKGLCGAVRKK